MLNFILMLISLAFGNNNANTSTCDNNNSTTVTVLSNTDPGDGIDPGDGTGGPVGGNTGQIPPPFTPPNP